MKAKVQRRFNFIQNIPKAIFILKNGSVVYVSHEVARLFGYKSSKDVIDKQISELSPRFQPDGQVAIIKADQVITQAIREGSCFFEWQHLKADQSLFWVKVSLTYLPTVDEDHYILGTLKDIDEEKNLEFELKDYLREQGLITDKHDCFIYKINKNRINYLSTSVKKITSYTQEYWLNNYSKYLSYAKESQRVKQERVNLLAGKQEALNYTLSIQNKENKLIHLYFHETIFEHFGEKEVIGVVKELKSL